MKGAAFTLFAVLLWGFAPVGTRDLVGLDHAALPALPFIGLRYVIATLCFLMPLRRALASWSRADLAMGLLCGLLGVTGYNLPNALGSRTVSAGMMGLLNGAEPLLIVTMSALAQRRPPGRTTALALIIGVAGILVLTLGSGPALADAAGVAWIMLSASCWSLYCVLVPPLMQRRGALQVTAITVAFGTVPMLLAGLPQMGSMLHALTLGEWEVLVVLSLGTSVVALLCWNIGAAILGPETSAYFLYLLPLIGVFGGAVFLGEPVRLIEFYGGALILASVYISQRRA